MKHGGYNVTNKIVDYGCEILVQMSCSHWLRRLGGCGTRSGCVNHGISVVGVDDVDVECGVTLAWMTWVLAPLQSTVGVDRDVINACVISEQPSDRSASGGSGDVKAKWETLASLQPGVGDTAVDSNAVAGVVESSNTVLL